MFWTCKLFFIIYDWFQSLAVTHWHIIVRPWLNVLRHLYLGRARCLRFGRCRWHCRWSLIDDAAAAAAAASDAIGVRRRSLRQVVSCAGHAFRNAHHLQVDGRFFADMRTQRMNDGHIQTIDDAICVAVLWNTNKMDSKRPSGTRSTIIALSLTVLCS